MTSVEEVVREREEKKPLGSYACGGKCGPEGYVGHSFDGVPCSKCRVFNVTFDKQSIVDGHVVRARNAEEALKIADKAFPGATRAAVYRKNTAYGKKSTTLHWRRVDAGSPWVRELSRFTREQALAEILYRARKTGIVAQRDWKLDPKDIAGALLAAAEEYMRKHNLQRSKKWTPTGPS